MNQFSVVKPKSNDLVAGPLHRAVKRELSAAPELASITVPVGGLPIWGGSLGWPDWLLLGSNIKQGTVPASISIADELVLHANLLDRFGNAAVLRSYLYDSYPPFDGVGLQSIQVAPDLRSLYRVISTWAASQNPHISFLFTEDIFGCSVKVAFAPEFAAIGEFMENALLAAFLRFYLSLTSQISRPEYKSKGLLSLKVKSQDTELAETFATVPGIRVATGLPESEIAVSAALADQTNMKSDPVIWQKTLDKVAKLKRTQTDPYSEESIRHRIRKSLENLRRVPRLNEMADDEGVSERTMSRELAARGLQYNRLASEVRMEMAKELVEGGEYRLSAIAELLGYGSNASFGRAFRQEFGTSPAKWRVGG